MMDVYHEEFRDSIAIDSRIRSISKELGVSFGSDYEAHEDFYRKVAKASGLKNAWELDRIMFHFKDDVLDLLRGRKRKARGKAR